MDLLVKAINLAMEAHSGQYRRGTNLPYITHPISVMSNVKRYKESKHKEELLCAAVLHDIIEDTVVSIDEIYESFGEVVAQIVGELTDCPDKKKKLGKTEYQMAKTLKMTNYALVIKLADYLDNITDRPTPKLLGRVNKIITNLSCNRDLTNTQIELIMEIQKVLIRLNMERI